MKDEPIKVEGVVEAAVRYFKQFDDYASWTDETAQYPETSEPYYLALGITEEVGELALAESEDQGIAECGDIMWYSARYAQRILNVPFGMIVEEAIKLDVVGYADLVGSLGAICGFEKKRIRDGANWDAVKYKTKHGAARDALIRIVSSVNYFAMQANRELNRIIDANRNKLIDRKQRDAIKGDGDNR